ncbi:hypothetical protein NSPZN2_60008 [Nitrospira defluvii]|uniref:Uncharacterized protein n=1 Tax=Nitrospira defluvii TaxID=330214 RepID=A0ABN7MBS9_9BACT|nr:hypothetical protein NSPZN2_60008 [Nitrospira defluvii]
MRLIARLSVLPGRGRLFMPSDVVAVNQRLFERSERADFFDPGLVPHRPALPVSQISKVTASRGEAAGGGRLSARDLQGTS